jgi:hypothetical protein
MASTGHRVYFLVSPESPVMAVITEAHKMDMAAFRAREAFAKEHGCEQWLATNERFVGLIFPGALPAGWRKTAKCAVPDSRSKIGRELQRQISEIPAGVSSIRFSSMLTEALGKEFTHCSGNRLSWPGLQKFGDDLVLIVPAGCRIFDLPGCTELKTSEYWRLLDQFPEAA